MTVQSKSPGMATLLPCPFCGGTDIQSLVHLDWVACDGCGASLEDAEPSARELWNRRAPQVASAAQEASRRDIAACLEMLEDVPGETLRDRVGRLVDWHQTLSQSYHKDIAEAQSGASPPSPSQAALAPSDCDWPDEPFTFRDEPGEHDPCYVVMPGSAMLPLNHHAVPGVDIARAKFIVAACNMALLPDFPSASVAEAMQDAWNTICTDTGCHPLDIERRGKELFFKPGHWADLIALFLSRSPSIPSTSQNTPPDWEQDQAETSRLAPKVSPANRNSAAE